MAKPLDQQVSSALSTDRVTIATLEELIPNAEAERDRLSEAHVRASAASVDFALSEADRDAAAANAERYSRNATALSKALEQLHAKLTAKRESDTRKATEEARKAALAERDELAERFKLAVPGLIASLTELLTEVQVNAERMRSVGAAGPDAEAVARGVAGFLDRAGGPQSFTKMIIPSFAGAGRCWPLEKRMAQFDYGGALTAGREQERKREERVRRDAEQHAKQHGKYRLASQLADGTPIRLTPDLVVGSMPSGIFYGDPWIGTLPHSHAEKLRSVPLLVVEPMEVVEPPKRSRTSQIMGSF